MQDPLDLTETDWSFYGFDDYGPAPALQTNKNVVVPRSAVELNDIEYQWLCTVINPLGNDDDFGISTFCRCKEAIQTVLANRL